MEQTLTKTLLALESAPTIDASQSAETLLQRAA
jgi:hypothetical protein